MKTSNSSRDLKKMLEFDRELESHCESIEDDMFDRKTRNGLLESGEFVPPSGTLFEAIFQELKRKEDRENSRHSFSSAISRFQSRRAKKRVIENVS